jgi:TolA-binding protein
MWVAGVAPWQNRGEPERAAPAEKPAAHSLRAKPPRKPAAPIEVAPVVVAPVAPESLAPEAALVERPAPRIAHDPKALFHAANAARRTGDLARAKRLYSELIAHAPGSDEAHLAHVSLGKLLLLQGQVAAAENAFQRYLESGGGPLSEEALFSRAQCLARLGRARPERAALRALLAAFPESVYASEAEQRLGVLDMQAR